MQIHQIAAKNPAKSKKRVGRGGKRGTYSGHGGKGQTARSGRKFRPIIRETLKRYPKLRGYKNHATGLKPEVVDIKTIEAKFEKGQTVNPQALVAKNILPRISGRNPRVKILGNGKLAKNLEIEGCQVSASAKKAIEAAGGKIKA